MCSSEAEADFAAKKKQQQQLVKGQNPSRFYTRFLFKAFIVAILCIALHVFTSQAPEFSNQTRIFEFLHLIIVGIAVSYGLFSRKTDETGKENGNSHSTFDNAHLYISRLLQVSSDFDEEPENESGPSDENRVQTWSNQYHRSESEVVVAENQSITGNNRAKIGNKPLLLPVRSLKTRVSNADFLENSRSFNRAGSRLDSRRLSRTFSEKSRNSEVRGSNNHPNSPKENLNKINNIVLPSPIPWGSRSGRMEDCANSSLNQSLSFNPQSGSVSSSPKSNRSHSFPSPKELTSLPSETLGKLEEDFPSKNSFYSASPPPPPPPPPSFYKAASKKELRRNYRNETRNLDENVRDGLIRPGRGRLIEDSSAIADLVNVGLSGDPILKKDVNFGNGFGESPRKNSGFDQESSKKNDESTKAYLSNKSLVGSRNEDSSSRFVKKIVMETDDDDDDDDHHHRDVVHETGTSFIDSKKEEDTDSEDGPDVDKKADEFIAKFREQIRLQRIESIKRSATAARMRKNSSR